MTRISRSMIAAAVPLAVMLASPALAQGNSFKVFAAAAYVAPFDDSEIDLGTVTDTVEASAELGINAGFEWRSKWFGLEFDYTDVSHDIEVDSDKIGDVDLALVAGTVNFHLVHTKILDFYFGPTVAWADWGDVTFDQGGDASTDSETAFGVSVGLDIALVKTLAIVTGIRYLDLSVEGEDAGELGVSPLISRVGLALRF